MKNNLQLAKNAKYEWSPGFREMIVRADIKLVIKELKIIEDAYGEVTPALIIDASRKRNSILHNYFEWDNDKAAENWRIAQARNLLSHISVKVVKEGTPVRMQAYQITKSGGPVMGGSTYTKFDAISEDNLVYIQKSALTDLLKVKNKLEANDLDAALPYIEKAIKILQKKSELISVTSSD